MCCVLASPLDALITDVYDRPTPLLEAQLESLRAHVGKYPEAYPKSGGGSKHG